MGDIMQTKLKQSRAATAIVSLIAWPASIALAVYLAGFIVAAPYFEWRVARDDGFWTWVCFGEVQALGQAAKWPAYIWPPTISSNGPEAENRSNPGGLQGRNASAGCRAQAAKPREHQDESGHGERLIASLSRGEKGRKRVEQSDAKTLIGSARQRIFSTILRIAASLAEDVRTILGPAMNLSV
ncbi:MAG TPA: hypothetical protein VHX65_14330 [Pirellulales bacterium]|nr:hypothetical protein [Pirellulales bacterium]